MRVSLRQIAREAGVSVATASFALRDLAKIKPETRKHVKEVADRLGYVRDPKLSRALSYARHADKPIYRETIALLVDYGASEIANKKWIREIHESILLRAKEAGYGVELVQYPSSSRMQKALFRQLDARGIRGMLLTPRMGVSSFDFGIDIDHFTAVEIGQVMEPSILPRVVRDFPDDYAKLLESLQKRGYSRIGLAITEFEEKRHKWAFLSAYLTYHHIHQDDKRIVRLPTLPIYDKENLLKWVKDVKPDAIVANGSLIGVWLKEANYRFPGDMGLCRVDGNMEDTESGLCPDYRNLALNAVNWLITRLEHKKSGCTADQPPLLCIPSRWNEGQTLKAEPT